MQRTGLILMLSGGLAASTLASMYTPGYVWRRSADWTGGTQNGGWNYGNPGRDAEGNEAWSEEMSNAGGGLGAPDPWYARPKSLLVWDADWLGTQEGVWSQTNDTYPAIAKASVSYSLSIDGEQQFAPVVRWINPTMSDVKVHIQGTLTIFWSGDDNLDVPIDADVAVVADRDGNQDLLFGDTLTDPSPGDENIGSRTVKINMPGVAVPQGGSIAFTIHANRPFNAFGRWFIMEDNVKITLEEVQGQGGCTPDFNGDGVLDLFDFLEFVNLFNAGC